MADISSYLKTALANHQASALSFAQAFATSTVDEIETFWRDITAQAKAKSIEVVNHEIVKAADAAGFTIPDSPTVISMADAPKIGFQPLKRA